MQFKRSKGNFRETDRVVRFKLIKSGKNWLRASTAALGLFRVVRGQVEETIIDNVQQDQIESQKHNQAFLKGLITVGTVFGGAVLATTAKAEDATSLAPTVSETKQETLAEVDSVVLGNTSTQSSESVSVSESTSLSTSVSASASISESTSLSLSEVGSTPLSTAFSESAQILESEVVGEEPTSLEEAVVLEQNTSEAELLQEIAGNYASKMTDTERRAVVEAVINKVQAEVTASNNLIHTNASAQAYADQRDRLEKAVDEMMTTLTAAGFVGNTNVDGKPAISAQLAPIAELAKSSNKELEITPNMDDRNGASVEDAPLTATDVAKDPHIDKHYVNQTPEEIAAYKKDTDATRYTFGIWDFVNKTGESLGYYATLSIDRTDTDPNTHVGNDVYFRVVKKSDGSEIFSQTFSANVIGGTQFQLPKEVLIKKAPFGNMFAYSKSDDGKPGNVYLGTYASPETSFLVRDVYDVMNPSKQGELLTSRAEIKVPSMWGQQSTFYKVVDPAGKWVDGEYTPTGKEEVLAEYTQYGIEGQHYTASNARDIAGYVKVPVVNSAQKATTGIFDNSTVGTRRVELYGNAREHFIRSEVVTTSQNGDYILRYYVLDPSKVYNVSNLDVGNEPVFDKYTLVYEKEFKQDASDALSDLGRTRKVESKNKDYFLNVTPKRVDDRHFELEITGWFSAKETVTYTDENTGTEYTVPKPFTELPKSTFLGNNQTMIVGEDATPQGAEGFSNFKQTIQKIVVSNPLTSVNYYYRKMTSSESASQSQSFSASTSASLVSDSISLSQSVSTSESNSLVQESISTSQSESLIQESVSASQSDSLVKESVSASQSDSLVQASVSSSQSESLVQSSVSVSQSESLLQESVSASQSDSLVQESVSSSQSESLVQESISASQSDSQSKAASASKSESEKASKSVSLSQSVSLSNLVSRSISVSQSQSTSAVGSEEVVSQLISLSQSISMSKKLSESVSLSQSESLLQESVSASQSDSLIQASVSSSQSESLVQASVSASQSDSLVQTSVSASQSESLVQESVSASQSESLIKESVSASQSDSLVQASVSASQSESLIKESVSASQSESLVQASISASRSESLLQASVSASQSESLVQSSVSASKSESLVQQSVSASQSESLVQESVSASQSGSLLQESVSASQSESLVQSSVSASQSDSLIQESVSASQSDSLIQESVSASQSDSQSKAASASKSESEKASKSVSLSQSVSLSNLV
ncbi:accessory Sec-dependent serine-rich glycoprotein adhesin, partial [Streptococcus parasanguinis]|uniref:accessory Sec-dependent serine-rich glycoprotein adhesin n=1 Tax=Streptococcus parasanguinis TaxID=1318 RepID=UPI00325B5A50